MPRQNKILTIALMLLSLSVAADPVPDEYAIVALVEKTLSVPAGQEPMQMPTDVALDAKDNVFIVDGVNTRIVRFGNSGEYQAPLKPALSTPTGLFIDHDDRLWVADSGNHRVVRLAADGQIEARIDLPGDKGHPAKPTHLLITPDGKHLYVVDNANHRILIREQSSGTWTIAGGPGKSLGEFQYPFMIAQGNEGVVHITETIGTRIQTLTSTGQWARPISGWGIALGQLARPKGIAIDGVGRIFVSDSTLRVVQVFSVEGKLVGVLTDGNQNPLRFEHPMGLRFDSKDRLYVVELKANRVVILTIAPKKLGAP